MVPPHSMGVALYALLWYGCMLAFSLVYVFCTVLSLCVVCPAAGSAGGRGAGGGHTTTPGSEGVSLAHHCAWSTAWCNCVNSLVSCWASMDAICGFVQPVSMILARCSTYVVCVHAFRQSCLLFMVLVLYWQVFHVRRGQCRQWWRMWRPDNDPRICRWGFCPVLM